MTRSLAHRTVLVVEDAGSCATTLEIALARIAGVAVRVVGTAEAARAVLASDADVCALITDLHLPEDSGLDLVRWVRGRENRAHMPIIVISGDSDPDTPPAALRLGANAYFAKPFSPSEVRHRLEELIDEEHRSSAV